jgi:hypothetical protein
VQTRIDAGKWAKKEKDAKEAVGRAWSKFFHFAGVPGRQADNPYFVGAIRETQKWGKLLALECHLRTYNVVSNAFHMVGNR